MKHFRELKDTEIVLATDKFADFEVDSDFIFNDLKICRKSVGLTYQMSKRAFAIPYIYRQTGKLSLPKRITQWVILKDGFFQKGDKLIPKSKLTPFLKTHIEKWDDVDIEGKLKVKDYSTYLFARKISAKNS